MLEQDFLALQKGTKDENTQAANRVASDVMREVVVPKITEDINQGKNFATLRQIYYSLILAKWFKDKFKESFYKHYINQKKIKGIDIHDPQAKEKIYNLYTQAFQKGIYNYIKREEDPATKRQVRRRYFSGGVAPLNPGVSSEVVGLPQLGSSQVGGPIIIAGGEMVDFDQAAISPMREPKALSNGARLSLLLEALGPFLPFFSFTAPMSPETEGFAAMFAVSGKREGQSGAAASPISSSPAYPPYNFFAEKAIERLPILAREVFARTIDAVPGKKLSDDPLPDPRNPKIPRVRVGFMRSIVKSICLAADNIFKGRVAPYAEMKLRFRSPDPENYRFPAEDDPDPLEGQTHPIKIAARSGTAAGGITRLENETAAGFFAGTDNPKVKGHANVAMLAVGKKMLDFVVMRTADLYELQKKNPTDKASHVSNDDRFALAEAEMRPYLPFIRLTNLTTPDREGFAEMLNLMEHNQGQKINMVYMISTENESRIRKYCQLHYCELGLAVTGLRRNTIEDKPGKSKPVFRMSPNHRFSMLWIRRTDGKAGNIFTSGTETECKDFIDATHQKVRADIRAAIAERRALGDEHFSREAKKLRDEADAIKKKAEPDRELFNRLSDDLQALKDTAWELIDRGVQAEDDLARVNREIEIKEQQRAAAAERLKPEETKASELIDRALYYETPAAALEAALERTIQMDLLDDPLVDLRVAGTDWRDNRLHHIADPAVSEYALRTGAWWRKIDPAKAAQWLKYQVARATGNHIFDNPSVALNMKGANNGKIVARYREVGTRQKQTMITQLRELLGSATPEIRQNARRVLGTIIFTGMIADETPVQTMLEHANRADEVVALYHRLANDEQRDILKEILRSTLRESHGAAIHHAGEWTLNRIIADLREQLHSDLSDTRRQARHNLSRFVFGRSIDSMLEVENRAEDVRQLFLGLTSENDQIMLKEILESGLREDPRFSIYGASRWVLEVLPGDLTRQLDSEDYTKRKRARSLLGQITFGQSIEPMLEFNRARDAVELFYRLPGQHEKDVFAAILRSAAHHEPNFADVRKSAQWALAELNLPERTPGLASSSPASSPADVSSAPGGIKMSNIPVISSPASQKIEFTAVGPELFDRLTFRITSLRHVASLVQFASVP